MLESAWRRRGVAAASLLPVGLVFLFLAALRRWCYRSGLLAVRRLPVPVVVVGNLSVGGSGKTPLTAYLAAALAAAGWPPGIVSRGYRRAAGQECEVHPDSLPDVVGDEPLLLRRITGCPVAVGADRAAAARLLLLAHPGLRVILADDGLQHYGLGRDIEIAITGADSELNGWPLPAGPMREGRWRLREVSAVVTPDAVPPAPTFAPPCFRMTPGTGRFRALRQPDRTCAADELRGLRLHAVAGIARPERFFSSLARLGLAPECHAFPDHHRYRADDLPSDADAILTTEKDAVKLERLDSKIPVWVLPLNCAIQPDLGQFVVEKLNGFPPA